MPWCKEKASKIQLQRSNHQLIHRVITIDNIIYALNFNSSLIFLQFLFLQVISFHFPIIIVLLKIVARKYMFVDYYSLFAGYHTWITFLGE